MRARHRRRPRARRRDDLFRPRVPAVFDGVAYLPDGPGEDGSRDMCLLRADGSEDVFAAELDLDQLRDYREHEVQGNAYRHPELYGMLCSGAVDSPFVRPNRRVVPMPERG